MNDKINVLLNGDISAATPILENIIQLNNGLFKFPELDHDNLRPQLWCALFDYLKNPKMAVVHHLCLSNIRILSREKTQLDDIVCESWINILLELSGLYQLTVVEDESHADQTPSDNIIIESLKCLCNLVFNSKAVQDLCQKNCMNEGIICRLRTYRERNIPHEIKYFDMKLLFAITALCPAVREKVKNEYHGFAYLIESLDELLKDLLPLTPAFQNTQSRDHPYFINDTELDLSCEILKTLFNLILQYKNSNFDEDDETYILRLIIICHSLLLCKTSSNEKKNELHSNIVNFLTSVPNSCYDELAPLVANFKTYSKDYEFEGRNMKAVHTLIEFLQYKMSATQNVATWQYENLSPILSVMHKAASGSRYLRKYLRSIILPPLTDVHTRPEEGDSIRSQLCRLLTTPVTHVRDLTAEFLLILCKDNVGRMIKYTGYGNAAGHFANRGLLGPNRQSGGESQYSSDSEDSDTEEYLAMRHTVNPVTGCYEPPRIDPMAGCTEEQKEYEAMKLVNLMDQLSRAGVIQPCRVGLDGRPEPVEHVLQLQEDLPNQQVQNQKS